MDRKPPQIDIRVVKATKGCRLTIVCVAVTVVMVGGGEHLIVRPEPSIKRNDPPVKLQVISYSAHSVEHRQQKLKTAIFEIISMNLKIICND